MGKSSLFLENVYFQFGPLITDMNDLDENSRTIVIQRDRSKKGWWEKKAMDLAPIHFLSIRSSPVLALCGSLPRPQP